jgi:hypothetical protein
MSSGAGSVMGMAAKRPLHIMGVYLPVYPKSRDRINGKGVPYICNPHALQQG